MLAGAGTGKTRVLTTRFAHILLTGRAAPGQVLAVTFTNKAAREMRERVGAILGRPVEGLWLGTFHALCARMLRRHAELVGLTQQLHHPRHRRPAAPAEAGDGGGAASTPSAGRRTALMGVIQRWKDRGLTPDRVDAGRGHAISPTAAPARSTPPTRTGCATLNAADFGDLLLHMTEMLRTSRKCWRSITGMFRYILVDEYQDTNVVQYLWLRLLAQQHAQHLLRRRRRPVDLFLARRRGGKHPALRKGFSRRAASSGWKRNYRSHRADPGRRVRR